MEVSVWKGKQTVSSIISQFDANEPVVFIPVQVSAEELAQKILEIAQQAASDASAKDAEEEYEGRGFSVLADAVEEIVKLCEEQLKKA